MKELTGGEAEAQAGAGGGEGPGQVAAAAQVGVEVEAGGAEAGALTLQQLRSRKSSKRTGPIGDGQKSTTFLCQRWALLPQGRLFEKSTFLSFAQKMGYVSLPFSSYLLPSFVVRGKSIKEMYFFVKKSFSRQKGERKENRKRVER